MKTRILMVFAMVYAVAAFAQKNEIKAAEKALKALTLLVQKPL